MVSKHMWWLPWQLHLSTKNPMPYFQPPTQNPPSGFSNFGGGIPTRGNGSPSHGSEGPPEGGNEPSERGVVDLQAEVDPEWKWTPKWQKTSRKKWRWISSWKHRCAFQCSLVKFPLKPTVPIVVSTTNTHYLYGSFIKEIVAIPNLLC
jgi:hypothetical protein